MAANETSAMTDLDDQDPPIRQGRFSVLRVNTAFWVLIIDLLAMGLFGLLSPDHVFLTPENMTNIALDSAAITLIAAGVAVLLGAGELDISIGANIILASVIGGKVMFNVSGGSEENYGVFTNLGWGITVGVIVTVLCGVLFGLVNGLIVTKLKVNSFITTLGTLGIGTGLALVITGGGNVEGIPTELQEAYGVKTVFQVPVPFIVSLVLIGFIWWLVNKTRFGVHSLAIGSSREAARRAGIKIERNVLVIFVLVGFLAGVAAVLDLARFTSTNVGGHQTDALAAIAGAVIGGTALFGGKASITGAFLGSLLAVILLTGLVILGFPPYFQSITIGVVLIAAVFSRARSWAIKNET